MSWPRRRTCGMIKKQLFIERKSYTHIIYWDNIVIIFTHLFEDATIIVGYLVDPRCANITQIKNIESNVYHGTPIEHQRQKPRQGD